MGVSDSDTALLLASRISGLVGFGDRPDSLFGRAKLASPEGLVDGRKRRFADPDPGAVKSDCGAAGA